jgi:hypothetical protein
MRAQHWMALAAVVFGAGGVDAQDQPVASLPWDGTVTAGPSGTNYGPPHDDLDLWVIEDFSVANDVSLTRFESRGTVFPTPIGILDMTVRIYDAMPPEGNVVLSSVAGTGTVAPGGFNSLLARTSGIRSCARGRTTLCGGRGRSRQRVAVEPQRGLGLSEQPQPGRRGRTRRELHAPWNAHVLRQLRRLNGGAGAERERFCLFPAAVGVGGPLCKLRRQHECSGAERQRLHLFPAEVCGGVPIESKPVDGVKRGWWARRNALGGTLDQNRRWPHGPRRSREGAQHVEP